jgi:hypothetical protein
MLLWKILFPVLHIYDEHLNKLLVVAIIDLILMHRYHLGIA